MKGPVARGAAQRSLADQNLLLTQALELVQAGDLEAAQRLLASADGESVSLGQVFRMYQDELQSRAEQLRDSQERAEQALGWFAHIFRSLPVAAVLLDRQGLVVDANQRALDELGLDKVTRLGPLPLRRLMANAAGELQLVAAFKRVETTHNEALGELALRTLDGRERVADICLSRLPPRGGDAGLPLTLCLLSDRTGQAEARRARDAAAAAERQRDLAQAAAQAKTEMLSRLSHELRTPLNAVLGFSHLLLTTPEALAPGQDRRVKLIQEAGQHLLDLVDDVLQINRSASGQMPLYPQSVSLQDVVQGVLALQQPDIEARQIRCLVEPAASGDEQALAMADLRRVREVLTNLVSNAIKYNRRGGELRVRIGTRGAQAFVEVSDTGIGMTAAQQSHLFEPFNRLGADTGGESGHGLGLSIARALAQAMGGDLQVLRSEPGLGSTFGLTLPAA